MIPAILNKRFHLFFPIFFIISDLLVLSAVFISSNFLQTSTIYLDKQYTATYYISLIIWLVISLALKDYKIGRNTEYSKTFNKAIRTVALFVATFSFLWVFLESQEVSRSFLGIYFVLLLIFISVHRIAVHLVLIRYRRLGGNFRRAVIIGYDNLGLGLLNALTKKPDYGIKCVGIYGDELSDSRVERTGSTDEFLQSDLKDIDFIYVSDNVEKTTLDRIISVADEEFKKVKLLPSFQSDYLKTYSLKLLDNISIIDVNSLPLDNLLNRFVKRSFDILFSLIVTVLLLSWLYPLIALIIALESRGPIIFKQLRHGKGNSPFFCYKFRTMIINEDADSMWATRDDPRVTKFGSFLRKTSLDELPQFFNVMKGEMAIVGPRPLPVKLNDHYKNKVDNFLQRHAYKPGITGLAQAMGYRGEIKEFYHIRNRVKLDRFYLQNWSFFFDLKIIIKTIYVLLRGQETAY